MSAKLKSFVYAFIIIGLFSTCYSQSAEQSKFYKHVANYYHIGIDSVNNLADSGLMDLDIPVAIQFSQLSNTSLEQIYKLRLKGDQWKDIMKMRGVSPTDLYFMISGVIKSSIYSQIFNKFDSVAKRKWDTIEFTDEDVTNLVNLRFIYKLHDYSVFEIMSMRDKGMDFVTINDEVHKIRVEMIKKDKALKKQEAKDKKAEDN